MQPLAVSNHLLKLIVRIQQIPSINRVKRPIVPYFLTSPCISRLVKASQLGILYIHTYSIGCVLRVGGGPRETIASVSSVE